MSADFLLAMAASSGRRARAARSEMPQPVLERQCAALAPAPPLRLTGPFDIIAEIKARSPAAGPLADADAARRAATYAAGGAAAISVLTEPDRFGGSLQDLSAAAAAAPDIPVMRKDFLVDPYQIFEARFHGAGGVLLIARMLDDAALSEMTAVAQVLSLFVLIEAFDLDDIERVSSFVAGASDRPLIGINARNLVTLQVEKDRLWRLADRLPNLAVKVAESGIESEDNAAAAARAGYDVALIGSALMRASDPKALLARFLEAGRKARGAKCS